MKRTLRCGRLSGRTASRPGRFFASLALPLLAVSSATLTGCGVDEKVTATCDNLELGRWASLEATADALELDGPDEAEQLATSASYVAYQTNRSDNLTLNRDMFEYEDMAGPDLEEAFVHAWDECVSLIDDFPAARGPEYEDTLADMHEEARTRYYLFR